MAKIIGNTTTTPVSTVGKPGEGQYSEIHNDYSTNKAITPLSAAFGTNNIAGGRGFSVKSITRDTTDVCKIQLDSVEGLTTGLKCSATIGNNYSNFATITKIDVENNTICVNAYPEGCTWSEDAVIWISKYESQYGGIGTVPIGEGQMVEGNKNAAIAVYSHAEGMYSVADGKYSHAEGYNTKAGYAAHSEGYAAWALGNCSHAEGKNGDAKGANSHVEGEGSLAEGIAAHAEGKSTKSLGHATHSEGYTTTASGEYAHAEGSNTLADGARAHAEGSNVKSSGYSSHAEGENTVTTGYGAHSEGRFTTSTGNGAHAEGFSANLAETIVDINADNDTIVAGWTSSKFTLAKGAAAHAEGSSTLALGNNTHTEGTGTYALGNAAHAEGSGTKALGEFAHAEGGGGEASGARAHAEGQGTTAKGTNSHAEGYYTWATGNNAHAEGSGAQARHDNAHASGEMVFTGAKNQTAVGQFNAIVTDSLFVVGNGADKDHRNNAFEVKPDGSAWLQTMGENDNSVVTKKYVDDKIAEGSSSGVSDEALAFKADKEIICTINGSENFFYANNGVELGGMHIINNIVYGEGMEKDCQIYLDNNQFRIIIIPPQVDENVKSLTIGQGIIINNPSSLGDAGDNTTLYNFSNMAVYAGLEIKANVSYVDAAIDNLTNAIGKKVEYKTWAAKEVYLLQSQDEEPVVILDEICTITNIYRESDEGGPWFIYFDNSCYAVVPSDTQPANKGDKVWVYGENPYYDGMPGPYQNPSVRFVYDYVTTEEVQEMINNNPSSGGMESKDIDITSMVDFIVPSTIPPVDGVYKVAGVWDEYGYQISLEDGSVIYFPDGLSNYPECTIDDYVYIEFGECKDGLGAYLVKEVRIVSYLSSLEYLAKLALEKTEKIQEVSDTLVEKANLEFDEISLDQIYTINSNTGNTNYTSLNGLYQVQSKEIMGDPSEPGVPWRYDFGDFYIISPYLLNIGDTLLIKADAMGEWDYTITEIKTIKDVKDKADKTYVDTGLQGLETNMTEYIDSKGQEILDRAQTTAENAANEAVSDRLGDLGGYTTVSEYIEYTVLTQVRHVTETVINISADNNVEWIFDNPISSLTITYPTTGFITSFYFTLADEGAITITLPDSTKYIGGAPDFQNGQTWELNIKNGVLVGGLVE